MPSKTIVDFANQVRDYMRSAEVVEGKNLLENNALLLNDNPQNSISFIVNQNKQLVFSGRSTAHTDIYIDSNTPHDIEAGQYVLSGCPENGSDLSYKMLLAYREKGTENYSYARDFGSGDTVTIPNNYEGYIFINIRSSTTVTDKVFSPMLCTLDEWNKSHTYEPYYVPVKDRIDELEEVEDVTSLFTVVSGSGAQINSGWSKVTKCGKCINGALRFTLPSTVTENAGIIEFPASLNPASFPSGGMIPLCSLVETWTGTIKGALSISSSRLVVNSNTWTAGAVVFANFTYYTK